VIVKLSTRKREMWGYGGNHHEKLGLKKILCARQLTIPIQQVRVLIRRVISPIRGLPNPIRQVVPGISHIRLYPPHRSHLHPTSLCFSSTTLHHRRTQCEVIPVYLSMSLSWVDTKYSIHRVQHMQRIAYTEYIIHPRLFVFPSFSWLRVDPWC